MRKSDFYFELPERLIAQTPLAERTASRLLKVNGPELNDLFFSDFDQLINAGDLLVFNDTRVIPARLFGHKQSGGKVEILIERVVSDSRAIAHVKASKAPKPGTFILLDRGFGCTVTGRENDLFQLSFDNSCSLPALLETIGHMPLPPYISRADDARDLDRYQTVYARASGAVAAPTAGLHFDEQMLDRLKAKGVETAYVTLHVGSGTFQSVRVENLDEHQMHHEYYVVPEATVAAVEQVKAAGGRVIAIGTTSVRSLESASVSGQLRTGSGETDLFITPGYQFRCVDALLTNFHLPESTLLMLVAAFAGYETIMQAYHHAIEQEYRFFSYGDAMFLTSRT